MDDPAQECASTESNVVVPRDKPFLNNFLHQEPGPAAAEAPPRLVPVHDAENPGTRVGTAKATKWINGWRMRIISSSGKASD